MGRRVTHNFLPFLAVITFLIVGCQNDGAETIDVLATPAQAELLERAAGVGGPPGLDAIVAAVEADPDQAESLAPLHATWVAAIEVRQEQRGERQGHRLDGAGRVRSGADFLVGAAEVLQPGQMVALIGLLAEHRDEMREQLDGNGERGRGVRGDRRRAGRDGGRWAEGQGRRQPLFEQLDLSAEQEEQLQQLHEQARADLRELLEGFDRGDGPDEETRAQAQAIRETMQVELKKILSEEQLQQLEELRAARQLGNAEEAEARFDERLDERLDFLEAVLKLAPEQRTQLEEIFRAHHDEVSSERRSANWSRGGPMSGRFEGSGGRGEAREELSAAIREILDDEQREVFEALEDLKPEPGEGPRGWGRRGAHRGGRG